MDLKSYKSTVGVHVNTAKQPSLFLNNIWLWSFGVALSNFAALRSKRLDLIKRIAVVIIKSTPGIFTCGGESGVSL